MPGLTPRRSGRMLSAHVLIQTEVGKVAHIQVVDGVIRTLTCTVLHR
jgi:hypothetical protein